MSDPHVGHIAKTFQQALDLIDATEPKIRDMIERELAEFSGNNTKPVSAARAARELTMKIMVIRTKAIKAAFRHLRENLPNDV